MKTASARALALAATVAATLLAAAPAHATLSWSWGYVDAEPVVGPHDTITVHATLFNDFSSDEPLTAASFFGYGHTTWEGNPYTFEEPAGGLAAAFADLDLAPGEGLDFVLGRYVPPAGGVDPGFYYGDAFTLVMRDAQGIERDYTPDLDYRITVEDRTPPDPQAVPEPGTMLLALSALAAVAAGPRRRSPRRSASPR